MKSPVDGYAGTLPTELAHRSAHLQMPYQRFRHPEMYVVSSLTEKQVLS
ncbi:MAG: hypothetical protein ACLTTW_02595 [Coprobacter sp.]